MLGLVMVNLASAQLKIIPQLGINGTRYTNDPGSNTDFKQSRLGYHFGGNVRIGGKVFFEPGIYWFKSSAELEGIDPSDISTTIIEKTSVNSIKVPAAIGFSVINSDIFRLRLSGGPAYSWITSVKDNTFYKKEDFNKSVWSARFGLGLDLWMIAVDINYELGLSRTFADENNPTKSNILSLTAGLRL